MPLKWSRAEELTKKGLFCSEVACLTKSSCPYSFQFLTSPHQSPPQLTLNSGGKPESVANDLDHILSPDAEAVRFKRSSSWFRFPSGSQIHFLDTVSRVQQVFISDVLSGWLGSIQRWTWWEGGGIKVRCLRMCLPTLVGKALLPKSTGFILKQGATSSLSSGHCRCAWLPASVHCYWYYN